MLELEIIRPPLIVIGKTFRITNFGDSAAEFHPFKLQSRKTTAMKTEIFIRVYDDDFELSKMKFSNFIQDRFSK